MKPQDEVLLGAFLHDIGKILQRAGEREPHQKAGYSFLSKLPTPHLSFYAKYHHLSDPDKKFEFDKEVVEKSDIEPQVLKKRIFIVHKADGISAGERGKIDKIDKETSLISIFSIIKQDEDNLKKLYFPGKFSSSLADIVLPQDSEADVSESYRSFNRIFGDFLPKFSASLYDIILQNTARFLPAAMSEGEVISLYDHLRTTAAFAVSLYKFFEEEIEDEKLSFEDFERLFEDRVSKNNPFLWIEGDISGIQRFVYSITSKDQALRIMKGRSMYLEFLALDVVREILQRCNLYTQNNLLTSGGHFWIIAPNTKEVREAVKEVFEETNKFLFKQFRGRLFFAIEAQEFGKGLGVKKGGRLKGKKVKELFEKIQRKLSLQKKRKFIDFIVKEKDFMQQVENLCRSCQMKKAEQTGICSFCRSADEFAEKFLREKREVYAVWKSKEESEDHTMPFPFSDLSLQNKVDEEDILGLTLVNFYDRREEDISKLAENEFFKRDDILINTYFTSWYTAQKNRFDKLAESALGSEKIGVLKADVDSLGEILKKGLKSNYLTISALCTLSRNIELFFKIYINYLSCWEDKKGDEKGIKERLQVASSDLESYKNKIFASDKLRKIRGKQDNPKSVSIIYAGGDDLVVVGAWDDVVDFALDLDSFFKVYTGNPDNIHLSAGIAVVPPKFPFYTAIDKAEEMLSEVKEKVDGKNALNINNIFLETNVFKQVTKFDKSQKILSDFSRCLKRVNGDLKLRRGLSKSFLYKLLFFARRYDKNRRDLSVITKIYYYLARQEGYQDLLKENDALVRYFALDRDGKAESLPYVELGVWYLSMLTRGN